MKTVLIATDFSSAAHNAAVYGASLAKVFNARLILYSAYQQLISPVTEPAVITSLYDLQKLAEENLKKEAAALDPFSQIIVETVSDEGDAAAGILAAARHKKADIIVMGMKGSGKGVRKLMGSTVTALIRKTDIPVIVVPEGAKSERLDNIAFATESDADPESDPHILDMLKELGERFSSKLYLIRVARNKFQEAFELLNRPFRISKMVSSLEPIYETIRGRNVSDGLNEFIKGYRIDMLALLTHKHSLIERWFGKSTTRSVVFETEIPLLILPDEKK